MKKEDFEWKKIHTMLAKSDDWERQIQGCDMIKEYAQTHSEYFKLQDPYYPQILTNLLKLCNSLRSQLSRNALSCVEIMF